MLNSTNCHIILKESKMSREIIEFASEGLLS